MRAFCAITFLAFFANLGTAEYGSFTSYVSLEKLYTLEDELIGLSDLILNQEKILHDGEDPHNIENLTSTVQSAKAIHGELVNNKNITKYLNNPINVLHLTKRLANEWKSVIERLEDSDSCKKLLKRKVQNIAYNLPPENYINAVRESIVQLQELYNIAPEDLMAGKILDVETGTSLSAKDGLEIAFAAQARENYVQVVKWTEYLVKTFSEDYEFDITAALNLLSNANYKLGRMKNAVSAIDQLLKYDPGNKRAKQNREYILGKSEGKADASLTGLVTKTKKERRLVEYCSGTVPQNTTKQRRLFCTYLPSRNQPLFTKPTNKAEILSLKPLVIKFHDFTNTSQQKAIKYLAYEAIRDSLYKNMYRFPEGIAAFAINDYTHWRWVPKLKQQLRNLPLTYHKPIDSHFTARNVGMEGYETEPMAAFERRRRVGTFIVFLSDGNYTGGDVVFPFAKIKVPVEKGSVLFYESTLHEQATICPVVMDTEWVGIYPLYDTMGKSVCDFDTLDRPRRK